MTVETDTDRAQYATNGTTGPWTVPYRFLADGDLAVTYTNAAGTDTLLTLNVDYTVTGAGAADGGTLVTTQAYPAGGQIVVLRDVDIVQETEYEEGDGFPAKTHEAALDRLTMIAQQLREVVSRALRFAPSDSNAPQLPSAAARANTILGFDSVGNIVPTIPSSGSAADVLIQLADLTAPSKGGGISGLNQALNYAVGTLGRFSNLRLDVSSYPWLASPSSTDNTASINACLAYAGSRGGGIVTIPPGTFKHASLLKVPAGVIVEGQGDVTVLQPTRVIPNDASIPGSAHQGQSVALTGNGSGLRGFKIDGNGFSTGGVVASGVSNFFIDRVRTINGGTSGGCQSFQMFGATDFIISNCDVSTNLHGFQLWLCKRFFVFASKTDRTSSGLYTAACTAGQIFGCSFTNCDDVCLDFEGGLDCHAFGNFVQGGYNGELALFQDGTGTGVGMTNCTMRNNIVRRTATYINRAGVSGPVNTAADSGAIWVSSLSAGTRDSGFYDNDITVEANAGPAWYLSAGYGTGVQDLHIADNDIRFEGVGPLFVVAGRATGLKHKRNDYEISQAISTTSTVKNLAGGQFSDNAFHCASTPTVALITLYSDVASQQTCIVARNDFFGTGDLAMAVDQNVSGYGTYTLVSNNLTQSPTTNGGLTVSAVHEAPKFIDQTLLIAESSAGATAAIDIGAISALGSNTSALRPVADVTYVNQIGGVTRNLYKLAFMTGKVASLNGTGASSGVGASASDYISSIAGSVVNLTKTVATNTSMFKLILNSVAP